MLEREWSIRDIYKIDGGGNGMFVFYILNSSPQFVQVTFPQFVTFQRASGDARETVRLIQPPEFNMHFAPVIYP